MKIYDWKASCIDYPDKVASVVLFFSGCNFKCPTCHNKHVVEGRGEKTEKQFLDYVDYINSDKKMIDGVVLSGGEPTIQLGLEKFIEKLKKRNLLVKLDTNGSNYAVLQELLKDKLVDYIAMDIKGPIELYSKLTGKRIDERDDVLKGMGLVCMFPEYEYRTTIVPVDRTFSLCERLTPPEKRISWITEEEVYDAAEYIVKYTQDNSHKYILQPFVSRERDKEGKLQMMDKRFSKENLLEEFWETPKEQMESCLKAVKQVLPNTKIRGEE